MSLRVIRDVSELESVRGLTFVPTMGGLHEGHLSLVRAGLAHDDAVLVSIFVNPKQFAPGEDFETYPRTLEHDLELVESAGASMVFAPGIDAIYPPGEETSCPALPTVATSPGLEEAHRPHFFVGVCTVVARLLDLVQPRRMILGEKDYQQLLALQAMAEAQRERWPHLDVLGEPTVRGGDGLALSSRNAYLDPAQRHRALGLCRALQAAQLERTVEAAEARMATLLDQHHLAVDYAVIRDADTLMPVEGECCGHRGLIAAHLDQVRLIDNMAL